jgi:beta-phosphoglucomutase-like phosphatase (HAD superfamily)
MSEINGERSTGQQASKSAISRDQYDAALFDLDGVITDTASVHATCWKQMFDGYLRKRATQKGSPFRGIGLPEGSPDDPPEAEIVWGLGNRKNELVNKIIDDVGVKPYERSVKFLNQLRSQGSKSRSLLRARTARPC